MEPACPQAGAVSLRAIRDRGEGTPAPRCWSQERPTMEPACPQAGASSLRVDPRPA